MMRDYLRRSRTAWYSFLFVLPLLALYHVGVMVTNLWHRTGVVNGADAMLQVALRTLGVGGWFASGWFLALVVGIAIYRIDATARKEKLQPRTFALMLGESLLYAMLLGGVVTALVRALMPWLDPRLQMVGVSGTGQALALSLGAGLYEELVFRVLGMGGLFLLLRRLLPGRELLAAAGAIFASSLIFSFFHYIGPLGDAFHLGSFMFRFVAGVVLALLYRVRGFGIAACTHALYDVLVVVGGR